jgi:hypothetical protein
MNTNPDTVGIRRHRLGMSAGALGMLGWGMKRDSLAPKEDLLLTFGDLDIRLPELVRIYGGEHG